MKHVLWVNGWPGVGGSERAQLTLFRELRKRYRVSAVLANGASPALASAIDGLGIPHTRAPLTQLRQTVEPLTLLRFAKYCAQSNRIIRDVVRRERIDLVHVNYLYDLPFCAMACRTSGVPMVWLVENPDRYNAVNRFITNSCGVDAYAGTSSAILDSLARAKIFAPLTTLVPNSYDDTIFVPNGSSAARARAGLPPRIGFAGVFMERKGVVELCRAFVELTRLIGEPRAELWLAGGGAADYRAKMNEVLEQGGVMDRVRFVEGLKTSEDMLGFYRELDVFVMLTKGEGMSVAMLESMATGLPAAIQSPWGDDVIESGVTGLTLHSDAPEAVARALAPLVLDTERRLEMGRRAAEHLRKNFSPSVVAARLADFYEKVWAHKVRGSTATAARW